MANNFPANTRFVDIPGVRLAYDMAGKGAPLVFLHGGLVDRRVWDGQFEVFARNNLAIRYDMRSCGQSETSPTSEPYTHHEDLLHFLQALSIDRASLVGHSNYAIALDFALAHPKMVEKLILVSPGLRGYEFRDPWIGTKSAAMMQALGKRDLNGAVEVFLTMWVDGPYRTPTEVDQSVRERVQEMVTRALQLSRLAPNSKGLEPPAAGRFHEVRLPTFVVLGEKDAPDIHTICKLIHEGVAGSRLVRMPDVGHTLMMEKRDRFNREIESFLQP